MAQTESGGQVVYRASQVWRWSLGCGATEQQALDDLVEKLRHEEGKHIAVHGPYRIVAVDP